jgi:outer membrane protein assembly factor BamB
MSCFSRLPRPLSLLLSAALLGCTAVAFALDPLDWPNWRGPAQDRVSRESNLISRWDPKGENVLWTSADGAGISTPIVMNGKLYTLSRYKPRTKQEGERVVCLNAETGELLWERPFNVFLTDVPDTRVAWSSVVGDPETGRVYAMGVCGIFLCLEGDTGEVVWMRSLSEEFGLVSTYGGRTNIPVLFEDLVITSAAFTNWGETGRSYDPALQFDAKSGGRLDMARPAHRFLAMDKSTGEVRWFSGTRLLPEDTTYSTPTVTVLNGQSAMVFGSGDGALCAMQPRTGKLLWKYQMSPHGLNTSPLVVGDTVFMGQSEENIDDNTMGCFAAVNGALSGDITRSGELWRVKELMIGKSSPVMLGDRLYAADDGGNLFILDPRTGETIGNRIKLAGTMMRASLLAADGKLYACSTESWNVFEPTDDGLKVLHRMRMPIYAGVTDECYGSPVVSHGRIYLPTTGRLYCLGVKGQSPAPVEPPILPAEAPPSADDQPAVVQVLPAEIMLKPGATQQFSVRLFNQRGQLIDERPSAAFSVEGPGQVDASGMLTLDSAPAHAGVILTAKVGDLAGVARVRMVPSLPWRFDLADEQIPVTWVGARYRHVVRKDGNNPVMVKVTTIPKGTRSQCWFGWTDLANYTIQADMKGSLLNEKMPDMGLIAQRYTLDLMGASQQLQIRTWTPQLERFSAAVPFAWKPDVWYTLKFRASVEDGKAVLKGKVWPKADNEPQGWTVEAVDEAPNLTGSPGLFGNSSNAEITIDNVSVIPN